MNSSSRPISTGPNISTTSRPRRSRPRPSKASTPTVVIPEAAKRVSEIHNHSGSYSEGDGVWTRAAAKLAAIAFAHGRDGFAKCRVGRGGQPGPVVDRAKARAALVMNEAGDAIERHA